MDFDQSLNLKNKWLLDRIVLYIGTGIFALTITLTTIQVIGRIIGHIPPWIPIQWTEPLARVMLIVGTYFGAAIATRNNEHIQLQFMLDRLEKRSKAARKFFDGLVSLIVVGFLLIALRGSIFGTLNEWTTSFGSVGIMSTGLVLLGICLGLGLMLFYEVINFGELLRDTFVSQETRGAVVDEETR